LNIRSAPIEGDIRDGAFSSAFVMQSYLQAVTYLYEILGSMETMAFLDLTGFASPSSKVDVFGTKKFT